MDEFESPSENNNFAREHDNKMSDDSNSVIRAEAFPLSDRDCNSDSDGCCEEDTRAHRCVLSTALPKQGDLLEEEVESGEGEGTDRPAILRKRSRVDTFRPRASSEPVKAAADGGESSKPIDNPRRTIPRRNLLRGLSRVETPGSPGRHVRHSWLLRRLLSHDAGSTGMLSSVSGNSGVLSTIAGRNEWIFFSPATDSNDAIESSGVGGSLMNSGGRSMWPSSLEDSVAWAPWPGEDGWLGEATVATCNPVPVAQAASIGESVESCLAEEELILACPSQYLVPAKDDLA